jgi:hypothetical protein
MDGSSIMANVAAETSDTPEVNDMTLDETKADIDDAASNSGANPKVLRENPSFVRPACDVVLYCKQERTMSDIEAFVKKNEYSKMFVETPAALVTILVNNGYLLERTYVDGELYSGTDEDLYEDETIPEDASIEHRYESTQSGQETIEEFLPSSLISKLFNEHPEHADAFKSVLRMCSEGESLTKESIATALENESLVPHDARTGLPRVLPSYFTDKLERAGALEWKHGWQITEEGRAFLEKGK